jgi:hypothetical protein
VPVRIFQEWRLNRRRMANHHVFRGSGSWLRWEATEADRVELALEGAAYSFDATLRKEASPEGSSASRPVAGFHQAFLDQLRAAVAASLGEPAPFVPGSEALPGLRLIEECYRKRTLLPMPWLSDREGTSAQRRAGKAQ